MRSRHLALAALAFVLTAPVRADTIDGGVLQVTMPNEDVKIFYVESKGGMTIKLQADSATTEGRRMYLGDGKTAILLHIHPGKGIVLQGKTELKNGDTFKKGSDILLMPGHKKASELKPGDVYVVLPGVGFQLPRE